MFEFTEEALSQLRIALIFLPLEEVTETFDTIGCIFEQIYGERLACEYGGCGEELGEYVSVNEVTHELEAEFEETDT